MNRLIRTCASALALLAFCSCPGTAQEVPDSAAQAESIAEVMALMQPGEEHQLLEKMAGTWNMAIQVWMEPGADPISFAGRCENKMILGSRFLFSHGVSDEGMMAGESINILGFDRRYGHYTVVGYDTYGTYYITAAGSYEAKTKTLTLSGTDDDPVLQATQVYDFIIRFVSADEYTYEVIFKDEWHTRGGGPFKVVAITYTRVE